MALTKQEIFNQAKLVLSNPGLLDQLYDSAIASDAVSDTDHMADVMAIDAVHLYLAGYARPETDPDCIQWGIEGGYTSFNVTIQTLERVPVFIPNDGSVIYSDW